MNNLALLSSVKLPEFIREEYPTLVAFVEAYYTYLESLETIKSAADLDSAAKKYVQLAKDTVAKGFADSDYLNVRQFIFANKDFFSRKGTEEAFKFFFRAYFNEEITVHHPNFMVASGGEASGDYFFYVTKLEGTLNIFDILEIQRPYSSNIEIDIIKIVQLDSTTYSVYFVPPRGFVSRINDICLVHGTNGVKFKGAIKATPIKVQIVKPGKYWQVGQIFKIPAPSGDSSTLVRVLAVDKDSGISKVEVLQWGYPTRSSEYDISSLVGEASPNTDSTSYEQTINPGDDRYFIQEFQSIDNTGEITDTMVASLVSTGGVDDYFEDAYPGDYMLEDYVGTLQSFNPTYVTVPGGLPGVTNVEAELKYQNSIAKIRIINSNLSKEKTEYINENSLISNQNARIHDNLNYQAFAYSIQTETNINKYRGSIDLIHPAGTRFSSTLVKKFEAINTNVGVEVYQGFPYVNSNSSTTHIGIVGINITLGVNGNSSNTQLG